ncbi:hypothetical protein [Paenibacillus sp. sgz302251]|uniref:hypothetical protein n=1 Tax=Paenibacillus sp. sgz302251 TaxID=3414493 RepID=UPI003C7E6915
MEHQQTGKRSIALPITLVILVFSLIGNVLLYTLYLQHKQEASFETGQKIYKAAVESKLYFGELISQMDELLNSKQAEDRLEAKYFSGRAAVLSSGVIELIAQADRISTSDNKLSPEPALLFINHVDFSMQQVGSYDGPLKDEDRTYLLSLKRAFEQMADELSGFNTNLADNRSAIIRLSSGLDWVEHVERLYQLMNEQPVKHPAA